MNSKNKRYTRVATADFDETLSSDEQPYGLRKQNARSIYLQYAAFALLIVSNIVFLGLWWRATQLEEICVRPKVSYSPAKHVISYEPSRLYRDIQHNVFSNDPRLDPSPEFDAAWNHLIEPMTIKISGEELSHLPDPSIAFKDGSGYIAELAVYHELHCIKRMRRHFHLDRYYPNMTDDEWNREQIHVDHCLEYWRESAMCRGDTTLSTFRWEEGLPFSRVYSDHECVNWAALDRWARSRMVDMSNYDMLER